MLKRDFLLTKFRDKDFDTLLVLFLSASLFFPFYVSGVVVCAVAVVTMMNYEKRMKTLEPPYTKLLLGFFLIPFFVAAFYNNYKGMIYGAMLVALLVCGMYVRSIMNRSRFNQMMDLICFGSVFCVPVALFQKFVLYADQKIVRASAMFENANYYGMIIEFVVLIALYRIFTNSRAKKRYLAVIAVNFAGLVLSGCISGFVGLCCGVSVILLLKGRYKTVLFFLAAGGACVLILLLFPQLMPRLSVVGISMGNRFTIWNAAIHGIQEHPLLGQGAMSYGMVYNQFGGQASGHAHNLVLDTLLNFGFVGLGVILFYAMTQVRLVVLRFRNNICTNMNILVVAVAAATIVHGMTDVTIFWIQTGLLFLLIFSSTGIQSAFLDRKLLPEASLLPYEGDYLGSLTAYSKN